MAQMVLVLVPLGRASAWPALLVALALRGARAQGPQRVPPSRALARAQEPGLAGGPVRLLVGVLVLRLRAPGAVRVR